MMPLAFLFAAFAVVVTAFIALAIWLNDGPLWSLVFVGVIIAAMIAM